MQGLYQSTLVAQGAFSLYRTEELRARRRVARRDRRGHRRDVAAHGVGRPRLHEPTAVAFTDVPTEVRHFMRQRSRWARGMFEGMRAVPPWRQTPARMSRAMAASTCSSRSSTSATRCIWLPGLVLFLLGLPLIVSLWTLFVLPITLLVYGVLRGYQSRRVFAPLGLRVRQQPLRLRGLPARLPGAVLDRVARGVRPGALPPPPPLEVALQPSLPEVASLVRARLCSARS